MNINSCRWKWIQKCVVRTSTTSASDFPQAIGLCLNLRAITQKDLHSSSKSSSLKGDNKFSRCLTHRPMAKTRLLNCVSGVTKVGVTRGSNLRCCPYFSWKKWPHFLVIAVCKMMTFLAVRPRLSTVLSKFSHISNFIRVSPLEGVTLGGPFPLS